MNIEAKLLSRVINERDLTPLLTAGANDGWFIDRTNKQVWTLMREHFLKYQECPTSDVIHANFPAYEIIPAVPESTQYLIDTIVATRRKGSVVNMMASAIEAIDKRKDHEEAILALQSGLVRLEEEGLSGTSDLDLTDEKNKFWEEYEFRKNNPGLLGIPTGFPTIDTVTGGLQRGQLITIVAPPKTGKTTLALQMAHNVHLDGNVVMFQSFEMLTSEITSRYIAQKARVSHARFQQGANTPEEETRIQFALKGLAKMRDSFWLSDSSGGSTVSGIAAKIQVLRPRVVFIDGTYLMTDERTGESGTREAITNTTRDLKKLAQRFNITIVVSTQVLKWKMSKGQVTSDSIGYSSSFHQDSDVLFGLQREDEAVDDTRLLKVLDARNAPRMEVSLFWDWETGQFREISQDDL